MFLVFFAYGLYAIISNVNSCRYDPSNLHPNLQKIKPYNILILSWIFEVSLHANLSCLTSTRSYEIQCWIAVALIVVSGFVVAVLKYRKFKAGFALVKKSKTIQTLTVYI